MAYESFNSILFHCRPHIENVDYFANNKYQKIKKHNKRCVDTQKSIANQQEQ